MERQEAIDVARLAAKAMESAGDALWNACDLQSKLTSALYESSRVVARCERAHQLSMEVHIAAEEVVRARYVKSAIAKEIAITKVHKRGTVNVHF